MYGNPYDTDELDTLVKDCNKDMRDVEKKIASLQKIKQKGLQIKR